MPVSGFDPLSLHCLSYLHYLLGERQLLDPRAEPRDRTGVGVKGNRFMWGNQGGGGGGGWRVGAHPAGGSEAGRLEVWSHRTISQREQR